MIVILCLDETGGMLFNHRRQSRDQAVAERIRQICAGKKLWMNSYSYQLYGDLKGVDTVKDDRFLNKAGNREACLVETEMLSPVADQIEEIIVFWWNRKYPADFFLDIDLSQWEKFQQREYPGSSHDKITEEMYRNTRE